MSSGSSARFLFTTVARPFTPQLCAGQRARSFRSPCYPFLPNPTAGRRHLHRSRTESRLLYGSRYKSEERRFGRLDVRKSDAFALHFALGVALGLGLSLAIKLLSHDADQLAPATEPVLIVTQDAMSTMVNPPGRPGNLTVEQEVKLRELWQLMLRIFGVADPQTESNGTTSEQAPPSPSFTADSSSAPSPDSKRKKARLSIFRRKRDEDSSLPLPRSSLDGSTSASSGTATPTPSEIIADGVGEHDKHGMARNFRQALSSMKPEDLRKAFWGMVKHDHPDALLLRFLRARKWDVNAALVMAVSALHWRYDESKVDSDIMLQGEEGMLKMAKSGDQAEMKEGEDFMAQIRMGKSFLHGFDKDGRPLCFVRVRLHRQGEQSEASLERYTVYTIETARMFLRPPVDTATIVFDMTDFTLSNMDYTPVKFMIKCFEANYPESLGAILVHKAPWVFQGIWKIIKGWLDPVVAGKVHFTNDLADMKAFVDEGSIIRELGGPNEWVYEYIEPKPGENERMTDTAARDRLKAQHQELAREYEKVVLEWIGDGVTAGPTSESSEGAIGEAKSKYREGRDAIAKKMRDNYWELDPYIRARSVYDRSGHLRPGSSRGPSPG